MSDNCPYSKKPCKWRADLKELENQVTKLKDQLDEQYKEANDLLDDLRKEDAMETRKILINKCYGGYSLSKAVYDELGIEWDGYGHYEGKRDDPDLIRAVEKIGLRESSGPCASLNIVEIPADVEWTIDDYDGNEWIAELHRTWGR